MPLVAPSRFTLLSNHLIYVVLLYKEELKVGNKKTKGNMWRVPRCCGEEASVILIHR